MDKIVFIHGCLSTYVDISSMHTCIHKLSKPYVEKHHIKHMEVNYMRTGVISK